jgi:dolichol-phosphate mannosyltransferase
MKSQFLVCIPTYNERENIQKILLRLYASNPEIDALVIDDNSPDGTAQIVKQMQDGNPNLHLLVNPSKSGLGGAYRSGFKWAIDNNYKYVVEMDADGSHQPEQLQGLLEKAPTHDVVIGSRWVKGGSVVNWPLSRKVLSLGGNFYVQTVLGISVKDATAGFRIYSRSALETLKMLESQSQGYVFQVDGTYRAVINKLKVCEVPIQFVEREIGVSKMSRAIVFEAISQVTVWAIKHRLLRKPIS